MAWEPIVQDIAVKSGGAAVFRQNGAGVLGGVVVVVGVGVWLTLLHVSFVGVIHDSDVDIMPEWTGQGSAHSDVCVDVIPECNGQGSAHRLSLSVVFMGVFVFGASSIAFAAAVAASAAASAVAALLTDSTILFQSMSQVEGSVSLMVDGAARPIPSPSP